MITIHTRQIQLTTKKYTLDKYS